MITGVLYFSKDMETFATGQKRIKDLCDEAGCKVEFRMEKDDFVVAFYRNLREKWNREEKDDVRNNDNKMDLKQDDDNETSLKQVLKQTDYEELVPIIDFLDHNSKITIQEAMEITGKSRTTAWRYLQLLAKDGVVKPVGSTNNVSYQRINKE